MRVEEYYEPLRHVILLPASILANAWVIAIFGDTKMPKTELELLYFRHACQVLINLYQKYGNFIPLGERFKKKYPNFFKAVSCSPYIRKSKKAEKGEEGLESPFVSSNFLPIVMIYAHLISHFTFWRDFNKTNVFPKLADDDHQRISGSELRPQSDNHVGYFMVRTKKALPEGPDKHKKGNTRKDLERLFKPEKQAKQ